MTPKDKQLRSLRALRRVTDRLISNSGAAYRDWIKRHDPDPEEAPNDVV